MKETIQTTKDKVENVKQVQIEKETHFLGSVKNTKKNMTLFEINPETLEINPAEYEKTLVVDFNTIDGQKKVKKVVVKDGHVYRLAMNKKNALRKYQDSLINGSKK